MRRIFAFLAIALLCTNSVWAQNSNLTPNSPGGNAGGDLGGTYPNPTVVSLAHAAPNTPCTIASAATISLTGCPNNSVVFLTGNTNITNFDVTAPLGTHYTLAFGTVNPFIVPYQGTWNGSRYVGNIFVPTNNNFIPTNYSTIDVYYLGQTCSQCVNPTVWTAVENLSGSVGWAGYFQLQAYGLNIYDGAGSHGIIQLLTYGNTAGYDFNLPPTIGNYGQMLISSGGPSNTANWQTWDYPAISHGTTFTIASGCATISGMLGGPTAGEFTTTATTCAPVLTLPTTTNYWKCEMTDFTHPTNTFVQTAKSATSATMSGTVSSGDTIQFSCTGY